MIRFDPDTVENGHIYSSVKEEELRKYPYIGFTSTFSVGGFDITSNWIISQRHIVFGI